MAGARFAAALVMAGMVLVTAGTVAVAQSPVMPANQTRQAENREAIDFLVGMADKAIAGLADRQLTASDRAARFRQMLSEGFDVPFIGRFVLGRFWRTASEEERTEFLRLFEDYIVQSYAHRFGEYSGENMRFTMTRPSPDNQVTVFSDLVRPSGPPVKVEWKLRPEGANYKVVDVVVEGISMSVTQRDEFSSVIQRNGGKVEGLLNILRDKIRTAQAR